MFELWRDERLLMSRTLGVRHGRHPERAKVAVVGCGVRLYSGRSGRG